MNIVVKITPNDKGNPVGKLADAELHFIDGELDGLKLIGFSIWERRGGNGRNVTFPARQYAVNGERRSFALLRPISDVNAQERIRELIAATARVSVGGNREYNSGWHTALDLHNLLTVSEMITRAALERKESRGAHFRTDFPAKRAAFEKHSVVSKGAGVRFE